MSRHSGFWVFRRISSGRIAPFLLVAASILIWAGSATAQRSDSRGGSRGGFGGFGGFGGGGSDRAERMRSFFSQMRSGSNGGSSDDRREQMRAFFQRMQQQRDGGQGGSRSRGGREGGSREGRSRSGRSRGESNGTKPKPVVRVTVDLPENYAAMDKDKDGQLGLYEWKLSAIQQFRTLDKNRDGFLTPRELTSGTDSEETTTASTDASDSGESSDDKKAETSSAPGGTVAVSTAAGPKKDERTVRIAKYTFKALDKDKDGKLSAEEWQKSSRTRSTFEKKKVKLKLPIDESGFVAAFPARD